MTPITLPIPIPPERPLSAWGVFRLMRRNVIATWPRAAYEEMVVRRRLFGADMLIVNEPALVRHVLTTNAANYERPLTIRRALRPALRNGVLLSRLGRNCERICSQRQFRADGRPPVQLLTALEISSASDGKAASGSLRSAPAMVEQHYRKGRRSFSSFRWSNSNPSKMALDLGRAALSLRANNYPGPRVA